MQYLSAHRNPLGPDVHNPQGAYLEYLPSGYLSLHEDWSALAEGESKRPLNSDTRVGRVNALLFLNDVEDVPGGTGHLEMWTATSESSSPQQPAALITPRRNRLVIWD